MPRSTPFTLGLDFGTPNSVVAQARDGVSRLVELDTPHGPEAAFRSALCIRVGGGARDGATRSVVGRPVEFAGHRPDPALARQRYDLMFGALGEVHYVYEPLGAAFSYASRITDPATILVADFGGGASDFS